MKRVYLMRHAKSSWKEPVIDFKRPLNKRGKKALKKMGRHLKENGIKIDKIISSSAVRAYETAKRVAKKLDINRKSIDIKDELYDCDVNDIIEVINLVDDKYRNILIVGHNPTISELIYNFTKDSRFSWLPTAGLVGVEFDLDSFKDIGLNSKAETTLFITPKMID